MIGIFDSGIGGLTVVKKIWEQISPDQQITYFGDVAHLPYGNKSPEIIEKYIKQGIEFLTNKGAKIIIIACHTASSVYYYNKNKISAPVPVIEMIEPTTQAILSSLEPRKARIGILGTRTTTKLKIYERTIKQKCSYCSVYARPAPLLVPLIEEGWIKRVETKKIVRKYLKPLKKKNINVLVLACTHYPLLKEIIEPKLSKSVRIIDPSLEVVLYLQKFLKNHPEIKLKKGLSKFYFSDIPSHYPDLIYKFLGKKINFKKINLES